MTKRSTNHTRHFSLSSAGPVAVAVVKSSQEAVPSSNDPVNKARFDAIMAAAKKCGFLEDKTSRIGGRISASLLAQAKQRTGIRADTDLIEFALANLALVDDFASVFALSRGEIDPELKIGF